MGAGVKKIIKKLGSHFFHLAEHSQDIVWVRSSSWNEYLYVSPAYESIWGVSAQSLYESPGRWLDAVVTEDKDPLRQKLIDFQSSCRADTEFHAEYRIRNKINQIRWIKEYATPVYEYGRCIGFTGVAKDVTHTKKRVKELDNASYFFKYFAEKIESVFWVRDKSGSKQLYLSPSYEKVWGRSLESLYDHPQSWIETLLPEDRKINDMSLRLIDEDNEGEDKKFESRFRIVKPNGEIRWIKDINFPISDETGEFIGFAGIADDITADVLRERELMDAKVNAEKANQAKSDFLAMMSHELRTPLNAILGMAQILDSTVLSDEQKSHLDVINYSGHNLLALLSDLLDFSKLEAGALSFNKEPIDLRQLVVRLVSDLRSSAKEKGLQLQLSYNVSENQRISCDPKRLRQVLANLVSNAIKFTDNGHVLLTVSLVQETKSQYVICFTVEDTGIGIEKSKLDTIFGRFQQVDTVYQRKHDGVGLGLAIVKELVEKMGGTTMVSSELGVGSQFSCILSFELVQTEMLSQGEGLELISNLKYPAKSTYRKYNMKVLVVEDNLINQKISRLLLEQIGCQVDIADCSKTALEKIHGGYDIVFMDIGLPDMDGFETVEAIRRIEGANSEHVPIIAMTAHVFQQDKERCFEVGMNEVIAKPILLQKLVEILDRWAPKQSNVS